MALALSLLQSGSFDGSDVSQGILRIYFKVTPTGNYPALGDTMDFTTLAGAPILSSYAPIYVDIRSMRSTGSTGYSYNYIPGNPATQANGKLQILQTGAISSPGADLGAVTYPAGILGDNIIGFADFVRV